MNALQKNVRTPQSALLFKVIPISVFTASKRHHLSSLSSRDMVVKDCIVGCSKADPLASLLELLLRPCLLESDTEIDLIQSGLSVTSSIKKAGSMACL